MKADCTTKPENMQMDTYFLEHKGGGREGKGADDLKEYLPSVCAETHVKITSP